MRIGVSGAFVALMMGALLATPTVAAQRARKAEPPPPPQFHVTEATRTMGFLRLNSQVSSTALIGKYGDGFICSPDLPVYGHNAFGGLRMQDFAENFDAEAKAADYHPVGTSTDLFSGSDSTAPQLQIGAIIQDLKVSANCYKAIIGNNMTANGTITVEWQVFDPLEKKVLLKTTVQGTAKATAPVDLIKPQVARAAFQDSAKALLAMPEFVAAVRDPNGTAPSAQNSLFPEATSASKPEANAAKPDLPKKSRMSPCPKRRSRSRSTPCASKW